MLSPIDFYMPAEPSLAETYAMEADQLDADESQGQWDVITAPFIQELLATKSKSYWEGFISELADRAGVEFAMFPQPHLYADEF